MVNREVRPGIYVGTLHHRRVLPVAHAFRYPLFMVLLDIDRIPEMMAASWFTGYNRPAWASFYDRDHFGHAEGSLRARLREDAERQGLELPGGRILLLTNLRYLGYCFNPVSFYYCYDAGGTLRLMLAEVNNTFGGTHNYWLEPRRVGGGRGAVHAHARKSLYVSPFMTPDLEYSFVFSPPGDRLSVQIGASHTSTGAHVFDASLRMTYRPWTNAGITRTLLAYPVMTMSVIAAIHWQAARLWWKGLRVVPRPAPDGVLPVNGRPVVQTTNGMKPWSNA